MDQKLSELLWELKCAIDQALWNSERISATIAALKHAGQDVQIEIDAGLVRGEAQGFLDRALGGLDASVHEDIAVRRAPLPRRGPILPLRSTRSPAVPA